MILHQPLTCVATTAPTTPETTAGATVFTAAATATAGTAAGLAAPSILKTSGLTHSANLNHLLTNIE